LIVNSQDVANFAPRNARWQKFRLYVFNQLRLAPRLAPKSPHNMLAIDMPIAIGDDIMFGVSPSVSQA